VKGPFVALIMTGVPTAIARYAGEWLASSSMMRHDAVLYRPAKGQVQRQQYAYAGGKIALAT
jgi:hypothetical protein